MILAEKHAAVLAVLRREPRLSQKLISERSGVSVGTVNAILRALAEGGYLRNEGSAKRPSYVVTPKGLAETSTVSYRRAEEALRQLSLLQRGVQVEVLKEYARGGRVVNIVGAGQLALLAEDAIRALNLADLRCSRVASAPADGLTLVDSADRTTEHGPSVRLLGELAWEGTHS